MSRIISRCSKKTKYSQHRLGPMDNETQIITRGEIKAIALAAVIFNRQPIG
jgi:hypothetical protein